MFEANPESVPARVKLASKEEKQNRVVEKPLDLLFVLLPAKSASLYSLVKQAGDQLTGVHTICLVCGNCKDQKRNPYWGPRLDPQTIGNLLMKFNLKTNLQGVNQALGGGTPILDGLTMLMGMDVVSCPSSPIRMLRR